eukprot:1911917-Alexandrium_andersonii.AAC.1
MCRNVALHVAEFLPLLKPLADAEVGLGFRGEKCVDLGVNGEDGRPVEDEAADGVLDAEVRPEDALVREEAVVQEPSP